MNPRLARKQLRGNAVVGVLWTPIYPALLSPASSDLLSIFYWMLLSSLDFGGPGVSGIFPAALVISDGRPGYHGECYAFGRIPS